VLVAASRNLVAHKPRAVASKAASRNLVAHQSKVLVVASRNLAAHKPRVVVNKAASRAANKVVASRNLAADKPKVRVVAKVAAQPVDKAAKAVVANKVVGRVAVKPVEQLVGPAVEQLAVRQTVRVVRVVRVRPSNPQRMIPGVSHAVHKAWGTF
jgi:hypothetical protein